MKQRTSVCTQRISAEIYANSDLPEISALSQADPQIDGAQGGSPASLVCLLLVYIRAHNFARWDGGGLTHLQLISS